MRGAVRCAASRPAAGPVQVMRPVPGGWRGGRARHVPPAHLGVRLGAEDGEGIRYSLVGDGAATRIEWAWDAVKHGPGPAPTGQARILLLLANPADPITAQLIASKTGLKYTVAKILLSRMARRGELIRTDRGTCTTPREQKASA